MYLLDESSRAAWVLNAASISAGIWEKFRDQLRSEYGQTFSLELETKKPPFTTAASAVWYIGLDQEDEILNMKDPL